MKISVAPKYFQEAAHYFTEHGTYTKYPFGTYQFDEFWEEETRKCKEGFTHGGLYIPGSYYFYLNYTQIELKNPNTGRKSSGFPLFTDVDLEYFTFVEKARKEQKGIALVKPRRIGFSYKSAAIIAHEFSFYRNAKCIIGAYQSQLSENTMRMSLDDLNFLDLHTEWGKERNPNTKDFVKARYKKTVDGVVAWAGYNSEIHSFTFKDNPFAAIGKSSNLFLFEEAGKWPGLLQSYNISEPCWKDGDDLIGVPIVQGCVCAGTKVWTSTGDLKNIEDLKKEDGIMGLNNQKASAEEITHFNPPNKKPCYRITTHTNNVLECSEDHPILWSKNRHSYIQRETIKGKREVINRYKKVEFKETKDIKKGDHVAIINAVSTFNNEPIWQPRLVGMLIGDGSYGFDKTPVLSNCDKEILNYTESNFDTVVEKSYLTKNNKVYKELRIKGICEELRTLGIYGQTKKAKRLPKQIFRASKKDVCELLAGIIDTDGCVRVTKSKTVAVTISSISKDLIEDIKYLFVKLGVHGSIQKVNPSKAKKRIKDVNPYYNLHISDITSVFNIAKNINLLVGYKKERLNTIFNRKEIEGDFTKKVFVKKSDKDKRYLELTDVEGIKFEIVKSVEYIGEKDIYNLTAGTTHTYIANNIVTHNTGGDMEGGTQEFAEMFFNPDKYNFLAFDNIWDEDSKGTQCGFFIPATRMRFGTYKDINKEHPEWKGKPMIDDFGNSLEDIARQSILDLRKRAEQGADQQAKIDSVTQYPLSPKEAFLQSHSFFFPITELKLVLSKMDDSIELDKHSVGHLSFEEGSLKWVDVQNGSPYREYPVQKAEEGLIEIYETPRLGDAGEINVGRYIAGIDPYRYDSASSESIGSIFIFDRLTRRIVAEYSGRPESTERFYEICRKLIIYYEATAMYEANITGLYSHFEKKKALHLLADTPYNLRDRNTWRPNTNSSKGIIMSKAVKERGLEYLKAWLTETISEESEELMLSTIRSVGLLKELIAWNPNPRANFDRVSAMLMVAWYDVTLQEFNRLSIQESPLKKKTGSYFDKFKQKRDNQDIWMKHFTPQTEIE